MAEQATIQLPRDLIESAIEKQVQIAMAAAMVGHEQLLRTAVTQVLDQKVDRDGKASWGHGEAFIKWAVDQAIRKAVIKALETELVKYEKSIYDQIASDLSKKNSPLLKQLATAFAGGLVKASTSAWHMTVELKGARD